MEITNDALDAFFGYSLILFKHNIKNGEKYFKQCLKWKPLDQYIHFQFALYLYNVMNNVNDAWYHLKIAINGHQKTKQSKYNSLYYKLLINDNNCHKNINNKKLKYFLKFCQKIYFQCGKNPRCGYNRCNNIIVRRKHCVNESISKHTCSGCKSKMYCSRLCQKRDWKFKHKNECIVFGLKRLSSRQCQVVKQVIYMLDLLFD